MSTGDWIALGAAVVALVTVGVMYWQLFWQKSSAKDDIQDHFNSLIGRLADLLTELNESSARPVSGAADPGATAKSVGVTNQLAVVGGQALGMLPPPNKPDQSPHLNWYAAYVLAITFENTWQVKQAKTYWDKAVDLATSEPAAQVFALQGRARYFFARNDDGDSKRGRDDYDASLDLLTPDVNGHDGYFQQTAYTWLERASMEYSVSDEPKMLDAVWSCFRATANIRTRWRAEQCQGQLFASVAQSGLLPYVLNAQGIGPQEQQDFQNAWTQWQQAQMQAAAAAQQAAAQNLPPGWYAAQGGTVPGTATPPPAGTGPGMSPAPGAGSTS